MIAAWTFMPEDVQTEGDYVLPRYDDEAMAREMASREVVRTGRPQLLCKVIVTERHRSLNENAR